MENQAQPTLDDLLKPEAPAVEAQQSDDVLEEMLNTILDNLNTLGDTVANLNVVNRSLSARVATLEKFVSYLMTKDPEAGPKMRAMAEAAENAEKKADEQVL